LGGFFKRLKIKADLEVVLGAKRGVQLKVIDEGMIWRTDLRQKAGAFWGLR
jgi:hypothetical protein